MLIFTFVATVQLFRKLENTEKQGKIYSRKWTGRLDFSSHSELSMGITSM